MTSSQPVVTPNALNFTPDNKHAYAFSGLLQISSTDVTHLEFSTNSEYFVGTVTMTGPVNAADINNGENILFIGYLNEIAIFNVKLNPAGEGMPGDAKIPIIIPPFSLVSIKAKSTSTGAGYFTSCSMAGKAYGMTETGFQ